MGKYRALENYNYFLPVALLSLGQTQRAFAGHSLLIFNELFVGFDHSDEHFNENFAMKKHQRRSKQIKYASSHGFAGFMRKIGMEHGNNKN